MDVPTQQAGQFKHGIIHGYSRSTSMIGCVLGGKGEIGGSGNNEVQRLEIISQSGRGVNRLGRVRFRTHEMVFGALS